MFEPANNEMEQLIKKTIDDWIAAELKGEISKLSLFLTDDFYCIGPRGTLLNKTDWMQRFETNLLTYEKIEYNNLQIRLYDNAAIATGCMMQKGKYHSHSFQLVTQTAVLLVFDNSYWKIANLQLSIIK